MANTFGLLSVEVAAGDSAGTASTVGLANYVRALNSHASTTYTVTMVDGGKTGTTSLVGKGEVILQKSKDGVVYASNVAVLLTSVTPPRG
tara:strand:+ start:353 stop:622 length:270 start_codon:yes stop_codon:yes gene_type:complete